MFESGDAVVEELTDLVGALGGLARSAPSGSDAERIDRIAALDKISSACAAARLSETATFAASQRAAQEDAGVPARRLGRGIGDQIGYARKLSPVAGSKQVTLAQTLTGQMPHTYALLAAGEISEWVAVIVVRETAELTEADRRRLDVDLAPDLPAMSPRAVEAAVKRHAYQLDPASAIRRGRTARTDRGVSIRPAPDTMARLTGFLPCEQGVAAWAALDGRARALKAAGDDRTLGQIRADTLVERVTGQATADAVTTEVGITIDADTLLDADDAPAALAGYGPIPADLARHLATGSTHTPDDRATGTAAGGTAAKAAVFLRRIFTDPVDETVAHIDTRRRRFDGALAKLIVYRDQTCTDPYCDAPIRHLDHVHPHADGGPTTADNGQGRCERGNHVKEMPGWAVASDPHTPRQTITTTPTGHTYTTGTPPALGPGANRQEIAHRRALRRLQFLRREKLIAGLPSP
ncbi:MAG: DUF222 domain-containing protein [Nocardioidaceae bacterium]